ncbi:MAG: DMT family transporter [Desulfobacula sp.]|nr:DMT family transporter [Desulfobacula sp.]
MQDKYKTQSVLTGYIFALGATALWSGNFIVARGLSDNIPPVTLAFCRWFVAIIVFTPFALKNLMDEWSIIKKNFIYFSITSLLGITTFNTLIYIAGHTTTAMNLSLIAISFPVFIVLFSRILYGELLTIKKAIGIVLVLTGVIFLITKGNVSTLLNINFNIGDVWMLAAAVVFAVYSLFLKNKPPELSIKALQLSTMIIGLFLLFPFFLWEQTIVHDFALDQTTIPGILYVGIFASLFAFILWTNAIIILGPAKAGMVYYTLPLFSGLSGYLFLHESIGILHFYSMVFIFSGILITNHESKN